MSAQDKKGKSKKPAALGRGLAALLGDDDFTPGTPPDQPRPGEKVLHLPIERIEPNPFQPRRHYRRQALEALADSIAEHGVLQPVVVRPSQGGYQLIAGERRLRASQMAGLTEIPAVVRQATDRQALLLALLENLQREDLNPLEEARAYLRLARDFKLSQEEIAHGVGKDRSTVTNALRLLKLPQEIQEDLAGGRLSAGHARALLSLPNQTLMLKARDQIVEKGLSVRATEALVKSLLKDRPAGKPPSQSETYFRSLAEELSRELSTKVAIKRRGKKGAITIEFYSDQELERLLAILRKS